MCYQKLIILRYWTHHNIWKECLIQKKYAFTLLIPSANVVFRATCRFWRTITYSRIAIPSVLLFASVKTAVHQGMVPYSRSVSKYVVIMILNLVESFKYVVILILNLVESYWKVKWTIPNRNNSQLYNNMRKKIREKILNAPRIAKFF